MHNEMGMMTANTQNIHLTVRNSEFGYGGYGTGFSHNIYVGQIGRVDISGCWFHHSNRGHLIKSRAAISHIYCNLIADGNDNDSRSSYIIDLPSGGHGIIAGNIIQKSSRSEQMYVLNFATESNSYYPDNRIYIAYNTVINHRVSSNNRLLNTPASGVKIYVLNNAIPDNTHYNDYNMHTEAELGNIVYDPSQLTTAYHPIPSIVNSWKEAHASNIDSNLPPALTSQSISLVPSHQYLDLMKIKKLTAAPSMPGAIQE